MQVDHPSRRVNLKGLPKGSRHACPVLVHAVHPAPVAVVAAEAARMGLTPHLAALPGKWCIDRLIQLTGRPPLAGRPWPGVDRCRTRARPPPCGPAACARRPCCRRSDGARDRKPDGVAWPRDFPSRIFLIDMRIFLQIGKKLRQCTWCVIFAHPNHRIVNKSFNASEG
jgi:hypothetical protein